MLTAGSDSYAHPGFSSSTVTSIPTTSTMHGLGLPFPQAAPTFPMNYPMPAIYPPYGYPPFAPQGTTQGMMPGMPFAGFNYHMPNYPMPMMYAPPSGYPFPMPAPLPPPGQGTNVDPQAGRKHQFMSNPQASGSNPIDETVSMIPNTDPTFNDWLNDTNPDTQEA
jgi:hypothetical protein